MLHVLLHAALQHAAARRGAAAYGDAYQLSLIWKAENAHFRLPFCSFFGGVIIKVAPLLEICPLEP